MTIFKYEIPFGFGPFSLPMQKGADIIHVAAQYDTGVIWAKVDPDAKTEMRDFELVKTGGEVPKKGAHLGSYTTMGGKLAFHLFEVK